MKRFYILLLALFAPLAPTLAQTMNLSQCIQYALGHNLSYVNRGIEASIRQEQYQQSKRNFLPYVGAGSSANKQYGYSIDPTTNAFVNEDFFSTNFFVESQLELFRGFARINNVRYQRVQHQIGQENQSQREMEIAFEVMSTYYDVLYLSELKKIVQEQVDLTKLNVQKTLRLIELGLKAESDLLEMKAQEASELHHLAQVQNQHQMALLTLKNLMFFPPNDELHIEPELLLEEKNSISDPNHIYSAALGHMPLVKIAGLDVEASQRNLAMARAELSPRLTVGGGLSTNFADARMERVNPNDPNNMALRTIPFADQWKQNMSQGLYVSLQIPIFNRWSSMSNIKRAKLEKQLAVNRQLEAQQQLHQQINEDMQQLQSLSKELELLKAKRNALHEAYTIAEKKLEKGLISTIEFYTAKNQLVQADADHMRTLLQLRVKGNTIKFYLGEKIY